MRRPLVGLVAVRAARSGDVHAGQVPARLHVPAQRADAPSPPLHRHPVRLHRCPLRHQGARHRLNHLPRHGQCSPPAAANIHTYGMV